MIKKDRSRLFFILSVIGIFVIMLVCNLLTDKCADDYGYCINFATKERLTNFFELFPSMAAHSIKMNGRLIAHFFVQLFLLLPTWIFKILNTLVFVLQIFLIYKISEIKNYKPLLLLGIFGSIWLFEPAFGQVNLWLDGSCNYLWAITAGLVFLYPYVNKFLYDKKMNGLVSKILFVAFGFVAGAFLENASAAVIFTAFLMIIAIRVINRSKVDFYYLFALLSAVAGYVFMMSAPAERANKAAEFSFGVLRENFITALEMMYSFAPLVVAFAVFLTIALCIGKENKQIILSVIMFIGALCANFIMTVASYYPERCAFCVVVLLIVADAILLNVLIDNNYKVFSYALISCVIVYTCYFGIIGINDIYNTHKQIKANESYIYECKEQGIEDVYLNMVYPETKYSAAKDLKYLDTENPDIWPNNTMAKYYGVNSIICIK